MAGAGYKLFNTGDVLTAAQVNTYLQEQTVMVFASSTARTTALSGVLAEGMMSYLQDTNSVEFYNGTSWVALASGDVTEVQAGTGISVASGTGPIPVVTNTMATAINAAGDLIYGTANDTFTRLGIGTAGQVLKVNSGATAPEWGAAAGGSFSGCSLTQSGAQTISNTTQTDLLFANETFDTDGYHSTSSNTNRITIPSGKSGYFLVTARTAFAANTTGTRINWIIKNGTTEISTVYAGAAVSDNTSVVTSAIVSLVAGDYITLNVYQTSGGNLNTVTDQFKTNFAIQYLGA